MSIYNSVTHRVSLQKKQHQDVTTRPRARCPRDLYVRCRSMFTFYMLHELHRVIRGLHKLHCQTEYLIKFHIIFPQMWKEILFRR